MTLSPGQDVTLAIKNVEDVFVPVAGLKSRRLTFRTTTGEATTIESGAWQEYLSGAGLRQANISGTGLFLGDAAADLLREAFFSHQQTDWQISIPSSGRITGPFQLLSLDIAGVTDAEATISLSLVSTGSLEYLGE